jgi:HEAT repeat protein
MSIRMLAADHHRPPTPDEWKELRRILNRAPAGDLAAAASSRYALHASVQELELLREDYENPASDDVRQRVLEIFGSLQSPGSLEIARSILNDESIPISDHLLNACAFSLARYGELLDAEAIFRRLHSAGDDPEPEGSLYSEADGLIGAIGTLRNPALEAFLCNTATGDGTTTNRGRAAAANALRHYPTVQATTVLYRLSQHESNPWVRKRAEEALNWIRTPE